MEGLILNRQTLSLRSNEKSNCNHIIYSSFGSNIPVFMELLSEEYQDVSHVDRFDWPGYLLVLGLSKKYMAKK